MTEDLHEQCGGKNAGQAGVTVPTSILDALTKAPELASKDYNKMTFTADEEKLEMKIDNLSDTAGKMLEKAEKDASIRVEKRMQYMVAALMRRNREI